MDFEKPQIDELLVVVNPVSTSANRVGMQVIDLLGREDSPWAHKFYPVETKDPNEVDNVLRIYNRLQPNQAIISCGGDGLLNTIGNALALADDEVRVSSPLLALPGGNANDTAISLNGKNILKEGGLANILNHGVSKELDIISVNLEGKHRYALSYVGLGYTALGSEVINAPDYRDRKPDGYIRGRLFDGWNLFKAMMDREKVAFKYSDNDGVTKEAQEMLFAVQSRMSAGLVNINTRKLNNEMVCVEIEPEHFLMEVALQVTKGKLLRGINGERVRQRQIKVGSSTLIHYDGEPEVVDAGSELTLEVVPNQIKTLVLPKAA